MFMINMDRSFSGRAGLETCVNRSFGYHSDHKWQFTKSLFSHLAAACSGLTHASWIDSKTDFVKHDGCIKK